jgi:hypothetical protein
LLGNRPQEWLRLYCGWVWLLQYAIYLHFTFFYINVYTIYIRPLSVRAQYSRSCPVLNNFAYEFWWSFCFMKFKKIFIMATTFSFSDRQPLNSVISYCTTVTTLNMLLTRGKLFTFGAPTDWPAVCCSCWFKGKGTLGSIIAGPATAAWPLELSTDLRWTSYHLTRTAHRKHSSVLLRGPDHIENASSILLCGADYIENTTLFCCVRVLLSNGCFCGLTVPAWSTYATISCHLSRSRRLTSEIPPISLCVCMYIPPIVATQRLGEMYLSFRC